MPENTGVSLEDIIGRVVAENVDALEVLSCKEQEGTERGLQDTVKTAN